jgi:hypothetical protein
MRLERLFATWDWLFDQLANPSVLLALFAITVVAAIMVGVVLLLLLRAIRWLMNHQFKEAKEHLLDRYAVRYGFKGIPRAPLILIAECMALVFALKMVAEMVEPFAIAFLSTEMSERMFGVAVYDWVVLAALSLLIVIWWGRFCWRVTQHDATVVDSKIDRSWRRTIPVFARPATALLLLMFLPDLGRFGAALAADWMKTSLPDFAHARAATDEPLLGRNYANGLQVSVRLEPKARLAGAANAPN